MFQLSYKSKFALCALGALIGFSAVVWSTTIPNSIRIDLLANVAMVLNLALVAIAAALSLLAFGVDILEAVFHGNSYRYR